MGVLVSQVYTAVANLAAKYAVLTIVLLFFCSHSDVKSETKTPNGEHLLSMDKVVLSNEICFLSVESPGVGTPIILNGQYRLGLFTHFRD